MLRLCLLAMLAAGCAVTARTPTTYRDDTAQLLVARQPAVKTCYDAALARDATAAGTIAVRFVVEKKTGIVREVGVIPEQSHGSSELYACVLGALDGLTLQPADRNEGRATFIYELKPSAS